MALIPKNWKLTSYTNGVWADLVVASGPTVISQILVVGGGVAGAAAFRITDAAGTALATVSGNLTIDADKSHSLNSTPVVLNAGEKLQAVLDVAGIHVTAHGAG